MAQTEFVFKKPMPIGQLVSPPSTPLLTPIGNTTTLQSNTIVDIDGNGGDTTDAVESDEDVNLKKALARRLDYFALDKMLVVYRHENQFVMKRLEPLIEQFRHANPNLSQRDGKKARHVDVIILYIVDMKNVKHRVKQYNVSKRQAERVLKDLVLWRRWRQTVVCVADIPPTLWHWITMSGYFVVPNDIKTFFPALQFTSIDLIVSAPLFNIEKRIVDRGSDRSYYNEKYDHSIFDDSQLVKDLFELGNGVAFDHYALSALVYMIAIEFYNQQVAPFVSKLVSQLPPVVVRPTPNVSAQMIKRNKAVSSLDDLDEYEDDQQNESTEEDTLINPTATIEKNGIRQRLNVTDSSTFAAVAASKTITTVTTKETLEEDEDEYFNGGHTSDESEGENQRSMLVVDDSGSDTGGGGGGGISSSEEEEDTNEKSSLSKKQKRKRHHHHHHSTSDSDTEAAYSSSEEDPKPVPRRQFSRIPATLIANQKRNTLVIDSETILSLYNIARQTLLAQANRVLKKGSPIPVLEMLDHLPQTLKTWHRSFINVKEWLDYLVRRLNEYIVNQEKQSRTNTNAAVVDTLEPILNIYKRLRTERRNFKRMTHESWFQLYKYERRDGCETDVWGEYAKDNNNSVDIDPALPSYPPKDLANLSSSHHTFVHLIFDRKQVPPLDLEESFHFFRRFYNRASGTSATFDFKIRWDVNSSRVSLPTNQYLALVRIVLPNLLSIHSRQIRIHRQVPFGVYHFQCESFFSTQLGRFLTFKSIISSFKGSKLWRQSSTEGIYPKNCEEQAVYFFKHLPAILTNYGCAENMWRALVEPIKIAQMAHLQSTASKPSMSAANRSAKKVKLVKSTNTSTTDSTSTTNAITNICIWQNSIYTALEAYYTTYCKHYMARSTLIKLYSLFEGDPKIQALFPDVVDIVWKMNEDNMTKKPRNFKTHTVSGTMEYIEIPYYSLSDAQEAEFARRDFHRDQRNFTPLHMYLYELMAGLGRLGDANRAFAVELFHSIRIINRNILPPTKERQDVVTLNDPSPVILKMKKKTLNAILSYHNYWQDISQYYANVTDPHILVSPSFGEASSTPYGAAPQTSKNTLRQALFSLMQYLEILSFFTFDLTPQSSVSTMPRKLLSAHTTVETIVHPIIPGVPGNHATLDSNSIIDQRFLNKKHIPAFAPEELESTSALHDLIDIRTSKTYRPQTKDWHQYKIHPLTIYNALPIGRSDFNEDLDKQVVSQRCNIRHYLASNAFVFSQRDFLPTILMYPIALKDAAQLLDNQHK